MIYELGKPEDLQVVLWKIISQEFMSYRNTRKKDMEHSVKNHTEVLIFHTTN